MSTGPPPPTFFAAPKAVATTAGAAKPAAAGSAARRPPAYLVSTALTGTPQTSTSFDVSTSSGINNNNNNPNPNGTTAASTTRVPVSGGGRTARPPSPLQAVASTLSNTASTPGFPFPPSNRSRRGSLTSSAGTTGTRNLTTSSSLVSSSLSVKALKLPEFQPTSFADSAIGQAALQRRASRRSSMSSTGSTATSIHTDTTAAAIPAGPSSVNSSSTTSAFQTPSSEMPIVWPESYVLSQNNTTGTVGIPATFSKLPPYFNIKPTLHTASTSSTPNGYTPGTLIPTPTSAGGGGAVGRSNNSPYSSSSTATSTTASTALPSPTDGVNLPWNSMTSTSSIAKGAAVLSTIPTKHQSNSIPNPSSNDHHHDHHPHPAQLMPSWHTVSPEVVVNHHHQSNYNNNINDKYNNNNHTGSIDHTHHQNQTNASVNSTSLMTMTTGTHTSLQSINNNTGVAHAGARVPPETVNNNHNNTFPQNEGDHLTDTTNINNMITANLSMDPNYSLFFAAEGMSNEMIDGGDGGEDIEGVNASRGNGIGPSLQLQPPFLHAAEYTSTYPQASPEVSIDGAPLTLHQLEESANFSAVYTGGVDEEDAVAWIENDRQQPQVDPEGGFAGEAEEENQQKQQQHKAMMERPTPEERVADSVSHPVGSTTGNHFSGAVAQQQHQQYIAPERSQTRPPTKLQPIISVASLFAANEIQPVKEGSTVIVGESSDTATSTSNNSVEAGNLLFKNNASRNVYHTNNKPSSSSGQQSMFGAPASIFDRPPQAPAYAVIKSEASEKEASVASAFFGAAPGYKGPTPAAPPSSVAVVSTTTAILEPPSTFFIGADADNGPSSLARFGVHVRTISNSNNINNNANAGAMDEVAYAAAASSTIPAAVTVVNAADMFITTPGTPATALDNLFSANGSSGLMGGYSDASFVVPGIDTSSSSSSNMNEPYGASPTHTTEYNEGGNHQHQLQNRAQQQKRNHFQQQQEGASIFATMPRDQLSSSSGPSAMDVFATWTAPSPSAVVFSRSGIQQYEQQEQTEFVDPNTGNDVNSHQYGEQPYQEGGEYGSDENAYQQQQQQQQQQDGYGTTDKNYEEMYPVEYNRQELQQQQFENGGGGYVQQDGYAHYGEEGIKEGGEAYGETYVGDQNGYDPNQYHQNNPENAAAHHAEGNHVTTGTGGNSSVGTEVITGDYQTTASNAALPAAPAAAAKAAKRHPWDVQQSRTTSLSSTLEEAQMKVSAYSSSTENGVGGGVGAGGGLEDAAAFFSLPDEIPVPASIPGAATGMPGAPTTSNPIGRKLAPWETASSSISSSSSAPAEVRKGAPISSKPRAPWETVTSGPPPATDALSRLVRAPWDEAKQLPPVANFERPRAGAEDATAAVLTQPRKPPAPWEMTSTTTAVTSASNLTPSIPATIGFDPSKFAPKVSTDSSIPDETKSYSSNHTTATTVPYLVPSAGLRRNSNSVEASSTPRYIFNPAAPSSTTTPSASFAQPPTTNANLNKHVPTTSGALGPLSPSGPSHRTAGASFGFGGRLVVFTSSSSSSSSSIPSNTSSSPSVAVYSVGNLIKNAPFYKALATFPGPLVLESPNMKKLGDYFAAQHHEDDVFSSSPSISPHDTAQLMAKQQNQFGVLGVSNLTADARFLDTVLLLLVENGGQIPLVSAATATAAASSSTTKRKADDVIPQLLKTLNLEQASSFSVSSPKNTTETNSPPWIDTPRLSQAITAALHQRNTGIGAKNNNAGSSSSPTFGDNTSSSSSSSSRMKEVEKAVLMGEKNRALDIALSAKLWPHALVLAASISRDAYQKTVAAFSSAFAAGEGIEKDTLAPYSPLSSVYRALAGDVPLLCVPPLFPTTIPDPNDPEHISRALLLREWRGHFSALLANGLASDPRLLVALGDRLWIEGGSSLGAHALYLLAGGSLEPPSPMARLVLVGADHKRNATTCFRDVFALQRSEMLELARRVGNSQSNFPAVQPLKLMYALALADVGLLKQAQQYLVAIRMAVKTAGVHGFNPMFVAELDALDDRLQKCGRAGSFGDGGGGGGVGGVAAGVAAAVGGVALSGLKKLLPWGGGGAGGNTEKSASNNPTNTTRRGSGTPTPSLNDASKTAMQQQQQQQNSSVNGTGGGGGIISTSSTTDAIPGGGSGGAQSGIFSSLRGIFGRSSNSGSGLGGSGMSTGTGSANGSSEEEKKGGPRIAHLGARSAQPYYDEAKKRWIFPGEPEPEAEAIMGPPPTATTTTAATTATLISNNNSDSSVVNSSGAGEAMSSLASEAGGGTKRKGARATRYVDPMAALAGGGGISSSSSFLPPRHPGGSTASTTTSTASDTTTAKPKPNFAMFAPVPSSSSSSDGNEPSSGFGPAFERDSLILQQAAAATANSALTSTVATSNNSQTGAPAANAVGVGTKSSSNGTWQPPPPPLPPSSGSNNKSNAAAATSVNNNAGSGLEDASSFFGFGVGASVGASASAAVLPATSGGAQWDF